MAVTEESSVWVGLSDWTTWGLIYLAGFTGTLFWSAYLPNQGIQLMASTSDRDRHDAFTDALHIAVSCARRATVWPVVLLLWFLSAVCRACRSRGGSPQ